MIKNLKAGFIRPLNFYNKLLMQLYALDVNR